MSLPPHINDRVKESYVTVGSRDSVQQVLPVSGAGDTLDIDSTGQLEVVLSGYVDDNNSSSTPLSAGATFTGTKTEVIDYGIIYVNVYSDVASASDGLEIQFSSDGVTWRGGLGDTFTISANLDKTFSFQAHKKYFRVLYQNGGSDQTSFDLQTILKKVNGKPSSHRIQDSISEEDDAELVKAVITGENASGNFVNASLTNGGNFKVSLEELESGVSVNSNSQLKITQFDSSGNELFTGDKPARVDFPPTYFDIFGKFETAAPYKLYEYSAGYPLDTTRYIDTLTSGSGTVVRNATKTQIEFTTTTASGDRALFQTRRNIQYNKANAQQIFFIYRPNPLTNRRERFGPHDDNNGTFFEIEGSNVNIVVRSNTSGSIVDTKFAQADWDDPLNGTGASGKTIDWTKQIVFKIEFGWLSSRGIRYFIDIEGDIILVKSYFVSDTLTVPYFAVPTLPFRVDVENINTTAQTQVNSLSCIAFLSSGAQQQEGPIRNISSDTTAVSASTTETIVDGIRLNSSYLNGSLQPIRLSILPASGNTFLRYRLRYNPTLTSAVWATGTGIHDTLTSVSSFTGGDIILSGIVALSNQATQASIISELKEDVYVGRDASNNPDALVLTVETTSSSGTLHYDFDFKEYI